MKLNKSRGYTVFVVCNYILMTLMAILCIFPVLHVVALAFSSSTAASSGKVVLLPVEFTWKSFLFVIQNGDFMRAFGVSLYRVLLGVPINMLMTVLVAYPLSRTKAQFRSITFFSWFFLITMLFSGGLIPWYMVIQMTGLLNSIWALVIPSAVPIFNVILLINYFRSIPVEFEEAAYMDGAGHGSILWKIFLPVSIPTLATVTLFSLIGHWNSWFDGLILMNMPEKYPLQSYLQTIIINRDPNTLTQRDLDLLKIVNEKTIKAAQILIAMFPIMCVYPFLQKYFTTGLVVGGIKG